jgi:hypothetical protein
MEQLTLYQIVCAVTSVPSQGPKLQCSHHIRKENIESALISFYESRWLGTFVLKMNNENIKKLKDIGGIDNLPIALFSETIIEDLGFLKITEHSEGDFPFFFPLNEGGGRC